MAKDNRKKGCPNTACENNKNNVSQRADVNFCPKCGTPLVFVCAKCFSEIEDLGPEHRICARCEAVADQNLDRIKDGLVRVGKTGGAAVATLGIAIASKAIPGVKKVVVDKGAKVVVDVVKHVVH